MKDLIYYNPRIVTEFEKENLPGLQRFFTFYKIFDISSGFIDRTQTIKLPVRTKLLYPIPEFKKFTKTFEEVCNERAQELLEMAKKRDCKIFTFYSGGIDSTLMMVSMLKVFKEEDLSRIIVLLSEESIKENPNFYEKSIRGKLKTHSSNAYTYLFNTKDIFLLAENNDQLFGSDAVGDLIKEYGETVIHQPYNRKLFFDFFSSRIGGPTEVDFFLDIFEKQNKAAPIPINTNFLFLWWINFSCRWQGVAVRPIAKIDDSILQKNGNLGVEYIDRNLICFYNTPDFQLWSLNNPDKRIKDKWNTYKYVCKDIIYDYTQDADYRDNKLKIGSLKKIMRNKKGFTFIDSQFNFYTDLETSDYYNSDNDFK